MNCPIPYGNMLRKPQCHFGWDWNIAIAPLGLYGTVALRKLDPARIEHVVTRQVHNADGSVDLTLAADALRRGTRHRTAVHLALDGERVRLDCGFNAGETVIRHVFHDRRARGSGGRRAPASRRFLR